MDPKIYTTREVAALFGVSDATIRREISRGRLRCFYVGNEARFTMVHLEEYANVKELGKTTREIELEERIEQLETVINEKDKLIDNIKNLILKEFKPSI